METKDIVKYPAYDGWIVVGPTGATNSEGEETISPHWFATEYEADEFIGAIYG